VLVVFHLNKGASTDPLLRHEGSAAFTQVVRGGLMLGHDPDDEAGEDGNRRVLAVSSSNLAAIAPSLAYRIETRMVDGDTGDRIATAGIVHIGESAATSYDLLGHHVDGARSGTDEATDLLLVELADGPQPAAAVQKAAKDAGISDKSLRTAREKLKIKPQKTGFDVGWEWALPEDALGGRAPSQEGDAGHLRGNPLPEPDCGPPEGPDGPQDALSIERASSRENRPLDAPDAEADAAYIREHGINPRTGRDRRPRPDRVLARADPAGGRVRARRPGARRRRPHPRGHGRLHVRPRGRAGCRWALLALLGMAVVNVLPGQQASPTSSPWTTSATSTSTTPPRCWPPRPTCRRRGRASASAGPAPSPRTGCSAA
jgi:hypothetical protein